MRQQRQWRPVTAGEYDEELRQACLAIERFRAAVWAAYAGHGHDSSAPRRAAELRELRQAIADLRTGLGE